jgi:mono/diheme cytochrome c family protein
MSKNRCVSLAGLSRLAPFLPPLLLALAMAGSACAPAEGPSDRAALLERGRHLVQVSGCGDCHTPLSIDPALGVPLPQAGRELSGHPEGAPAPAAGADAGNAMVVGPTGTSFRLAFGAVYAANLTPDVETGLGSWTEEEFVRALRTGLHRGRSGRPILPPMPWQAAAAHSDEDLKAIFAYLRSLPPVHNRVPDPEVPPQALQAFEQGYAKLLAGAGR